MMARFKRLEANSTFGVVSCLVALCAGTAGAAATVDYGPFRCTFYGIGESNGHGYTGAQDWTTIQMADVQASIAAWDCRILNTPGRQINMHLLWADLDLF
jgi:hypothetical protein